MNFGEFRGGSFCFIDRGREKDWMYRRWGRRYLLERNIFYRINTRDSVSAPRPIGQAHSLLYFLSRIEKKTKTNAKLPFCTEITFLSYRESILELHWLRLLPINPQLINQSKAKNFKNLNSTSTNERLYSDLLVLLLFRSTENTIFERAVKLTVLPPSPLGHFQLISPARRTLPRSIHPSAR